MKRKILAICLCLAVLTFSTGVIYGMTSVSVTNEFETGVVDIHIKEFQTDGTKETPWEDNPTILPGDTVSKIPRIYNDGVDCYIRAKFAIKDMPDLDAEDIFGISNKWDLADDGYYYYKTILKTDETADLFHGLEIPRDFPQSNEEKTFQIEIDVDAIQAKNFTPNFSKANPWGNVEILKNENKEEYNINTFKKADNKQFQIVYLGDTEKLISNQKDFFLNLPYLMPGDKFSDSVVIENDNDDPIKIYFRTADNDKSDLLDKITLKITSVVDKKESVVYEGPLRAQELNKNIILATIDPEKTAEFKYEITVPTSINNAYTLMDSDVTWIFSTEEIKDSDVPHTGDNFNMFLYICLLLGSAAACVVLLILLEKEKKEESANAYR